MAWIAVAAVIWATYAALLGFVGGKAFEDDHTKAFLLAFAAAFSLTVHDRGRPPHAGQAGVEARRQGGVRLARALIAAAASRSVARTMLAVIPVRDGELPAGALETIAECGGRVVLVGDRLDAVDLIGATDVRTVELGTYAPGSWAASLGALVDDEPIVVLPASPDGRDLAPRIAYVLDRPLVAGAVSIAPDRITVPRRGGLELHVLAVARRSWRRSSRASAGSSRPRRRRRTQTIELERRDAPDPTVVAVHPPDVTTIDLTEADRIAAGGAGLDSADRFEQLARVAAALGGAMGATRVVTDRGVGRPRASDRDDGSRRQPRALPGVRHQRGGAAHERPRRSAPRDQRQHRPALPDDADVGSRRRERRQRRARRARDGCSGRSPMADFDVVVVGAGPAGACAATVLARQGAVGAPRSNAARSPAARTCTAASSIPACSISCTPSGGTTCRTSDGSHAARRCCSTDSQAADPRLPHRRRGDGRRTTA